MQMELTHEEGRTCHSADVNIDLRCQMMMNSAQWATDRFYQTLHLELIAEEEEWRSALPTWQKKGLYHTPGRALGS